MTGGKFQQRTPRARAGRRGWARARCVPSVRAAGAMAPMVPTVTQLARAHADCGSALAGHQVVPTVLRGPDNVPAYTRRRFVSGNKVAARQNTVVIARPYGCSAIPGRSHLPRPAIVVINRSDRSAAPIPRLARLLGFKRINNNVLTIFAISHRFKRWAFTNVFYERFRFSSYCGPRFWFLCAWRIRLDELLLLLLNFFECYYRYKMLQTFQKVLHKSI